mgnify:CR=1 FL=1
MQKITADLSELTPTSPFQTSAQRVETGPLQINDDWPGIFLRGDCALHFSFVLTGLIKHYEELVDKSDYDVIMLMALKGYAETLAGCRV